MITFIISNNEKKSSSYQFCVHFRFDVSGERQKCLRARANTHGHIGDVWSVKLTTTQGRMATYILHVDVGLCTGLHELYPIL